MDWATRLMRSRTSLLVTGSELTTATMKSAERTPVLPGTARALPSRARDKDAFGPSDRRRLWACAPVATKEARHTRPMAKVRGVKEVKRMEQCFV
ncbi:hypothetical protein D3C78_1457700 [compost metagenome]